MDVIGAAHSFGEQPVPPAETVRLLRAVRSFALSVESLRHLTIDSGPAAENLAFAQRWNDALHATELLRWTRAQRQELTDRRPFVLLRVYAAAGVIAAHSPTGHYLRTDEPARTLLPLLTLHTAQLENMPQIDHDISLAIVAGQQRAAKLSPTQHRAAITDLPYDLTIDLELQHRYPQAPARLRDRVAANPLVRGVRGLLREGQLPGGNTVFHSTLQADRAKSYGSPPTRGGR